MKIINISDGKSYEVLREVSEDWLKFIGKDKAQKFFDHQFLADAILKHPEQPLYIIGREIIDTETIQPEQFLEKKKRGRPKGSKNKVKNKHDSIQNSLHGASSQ